MDRRTAAAATILLLLVILPVHDALPTTLQRTMNDPFLARLILQNDGKPPSVNASQGLSVWRNVLLKGRLPVRADFAEQVWPKEAELGKAVQDAMVKLQLPRFVLRHPETVNTVLLCLLRLVQEFTDRQEAIKKYAVEDLQENDMDLYSNVEVEEAPIKVTPEELQILADDVASRLIDEFGGPVAGMQKLDQIFGSKHGVKFGLQDGIWQHTGWTVIPELQRQIAAMPELRLLMKQLGRQPTASASDSIHRFQPRTQTVDGTEAAQLNPQARSQVTGLTLSNSIAQMLPSEAVLLRGSPALRRLFWAKTVESKLQSYELSAWFNTPSLPKATLRRTYMPSAPGGPLIVCLDTSWSMESMEWLTKAVVLACVSAAHKQKRACQVVAFSNGIMDAGEITADAAGVEHLLEFLSHSFGGGTDVTGSLQYAMKSMTTRSDSNANNMEASDLLLVTDGEMPPVSDELLAQLDVLKRRTGLQIHGLLVGAQESIPLTRLCTHTHTFLMDYKARNMASLALIRSSSSSKSALSAVASSTGTLAPLGQRSSTRGIIALNRPIWSHGLQRHSRHTAMMLQARRFDDDYGTAHKGSRRKRRFDDDDFSAKTSLDNEKDTSKKGEMSSPRANSFNSRVNEALERIRASTKTSFREKAWRVQTLNDEKNADGSCWIFRQQLQDAVARVSENLVEREEEARLVVLGMAAGEHVLFLGPPGTAKSALGRRLSKLCPHGLFFQRLLTRFTTPEEVFGPLSLVALENDEYKRCTDGFLPKASVAFLDEIFKANSAILNTLLTILNERQFDNGAGQREDCPIRCVIAASNELPESDELDALYDRFLLRKEVLPVSDDGLVKMLRLPTPGGSPCDNGTTTPNSSSACEVVFVDGLDKVVDTLATATEAVEIGDHAICLLRDLRTFLREELDVDMSDRRLVKASRLLKISASSHGRSRVDPIDCLLLQHVAWNLPEQRSSIKEWLWEFLTPGLDSPQFQVLLNNLRQEAVTVVRKSSGDVTGASGGREAYIAAIESLRGEATQISLLLQHQTEDLSRHIELLGRSTDHLWLDPDEARAAQQLLFPKAEAALNDSNQALAHAQALVLALSDGEPSAPSDDVRLAVIELLWDDDDTSTGYIFTDHDLGLGMKEAKAKYDSETFRKWKRARKKASKRSL